MDFSFNIILLIVFHILTAFAVLKDCTARGIKKKDAYVISSFFFPIIAGIVYGCKRKKLSQADDIPENSSKLISSAKVLSVIAVITLAASGVAGTMTMNNSDPMLTEHYDIIKYDRESNPYFFYQKVKFYDRQGNVYYKDDFNSGFIDAQTNEEYDYLNCYVDKDGYFVQRDAYSGTLDHMIFHDGSEHSYLLGITAQWNKDGELYDSDGNRIYLT